MLAFSSEAEFKVVLFVCDQFIAAEPDHKINSLLLCVGMDGISVIQLRRCGCV